MLGLQENGFRHQNEHMMTNNTFNDFCFISLLIPHVITAKLRWSIYLRLLELENSILWFKKNIL